MGSDIGPMSADPEELREEETILTAEEQTEETEEIEETEEEEDPTPALSLIEEQKDTEEALTSPEEEDEDHHLLEEEDLQERDHTPKTPENRTPQKEDLQVLLLEDPSPETRESLAEITQEIKDLILLDNNNPQKNKTALRTIRMNND